MKKILSLLVFSWWAMLPIMALHLNVGDTETLNIGNVPYLKNAIWTISRPNDVVFTQTPQYYTTQVYIKAVNAFPATTPCIVQCTYYYYDLDPVKHTYTYLRSDFKSWTIFVGESGKSDDDNNNGSHQQEVGPTGIRLPSNMEMILNTKQTLTPTLTPYGIKDNLTWISSNTNVAVVYPSGLVEAKKEGEADITARTSNGLSATCHVSVIYANVVPTSIRVLSEAPYMNMELGDEKVVSVSIYPSNAYESTTWNIENTEIVDFRDATLGNKANILVAKRIGTTYLKITTINGLTVSYRISVWSKGFNVESVPGMAVDLGLSVLWASCNVGAYFEEEYGNYYMWGSTDCTIKEGTQPSISNISKTDYDVAHVKWGSGWRIPTKSEFQELLDKCTWTWTCVNNVWGYTVTGRNGNKIFLPCAGFRNNKVDTTNKEEDYADGAYWTATSLVDVMFQKGYHKTYSWNHWITTREAIRPVINYNETAIVNILGDVNGDGSVNGTDLVALANIILGKQAKTAIADVNGDGSVNGTDLVALANIILGRTSMDHEKVTTK